MPTGSCNYPGHHSGPSGSPVLGLILAIAAGAFIVEQWRKIVVCLIVAAVLIALASAVVMLWHRRHDLHPASESALKLPAAEQRVVVGPAAARAVAARTAALEAELAALRARQIDAPAQHIHFHGVRPEDAAAAIATTRKEDPQW